MNLPTIVLPWPERTLITLTGNDRSSYLHNLCTADINRLQPGQDTEAFITNVQGKTIGHVIVGCQEDRLWLTSVPQQTDALMAHLDKYLITEDVELRDERASYQQFLLSGPESPAILKRVLCVDAADAISTTAFSDRPALLWRMPFTTDESYAILWQSDQEDVDASSSNSPLVSALVAAGAELDSEVELERRRLLHGFPWFGIDVTESNLPQEIARNDQAISFTKGCYLGQETVARIDALGHVNKVLTRIDSHQPIATGDELFAADKPAGKITSTAPSNGSYVGLAFVRRELAEANAVLTLQDGREVRQISTNPVP